MTIHAQSPAPPDLAPDDAEEDPWNGATCRTVDESSGIVVEMRTDGVPIGLALPPGLITRGADDLAAALLRAFGAAGEDARRLLEQLAEED